MIVLGNAFVFGISTGGFSSVRAIFEVTLRGGQEIVFGLAAVVVPEPSTAILIGLGLSFIGAQRPTGTRRSGH